MHPLFVITVCVLWQWAFITIGENGRFTGYKPLGWVDDKNVVYSKKSVLRRPQNLVYNLDLKQSKIFSGNINDLYVYNCNTNNAHFMGMVDESCLPDRNMAAFGTSNQVLVSPNNQWLAVSVTIPNDSPIDLVIVKR